MLKRRLYEKLKDKLGELLFGFDEQQLDVGFFGGDIYLKDLIFRPKKINEIFEEKNLPFALKAGMIAKMDIKISAWKLFSESMSVSVEDVHFILGPRTSHLSENEDYCWDIRENYDCRNPLVNIAEMHKRVRAQ